MSVLRDTPIGALRDPRIEAITAALGRAPRVLHIGNIANNAYNNARVQRAYGVEADVLCYDYYHVMATPEWEDGGLTTRPDPDLPDWWATNLGGLRRPDWYAQGPLDLCLAYLDARRRGDADLIEGTRAALEAAYIDLLRVRGLSRGETWRDPRPFERRHRVLGPLRAAMARLRAGQSPDLRLAAAQAAWAIRVAARMRIEAPAARLRADLEEARRLVLWPILAAAAASPPTIAAPRLTLAAYRAARRLAGWPTRDDADVAREAAALVAPGVTISWPRALNRLARVAASAVVDLVFISLRRVLRLSESGSAGASAAQRREQAQRLVAGWADAGDLTGVDAARRAELIEHIARHSLVFGPTLAHYDIVQGYSIDGFIPLVNGVRAFASYEHGTLRELPFEASLTGLICNLAYRKSPAVFVTNTDVLPSVARLGLAPEHVHRLPHAFDDRKLMNWRDAHPELAPPADHVAFFSPTRQHWRDANPSLTKGNDMMLRAAGRLWAQGRRFRMILVEWGVDLAESRRLIDELGFAEAVVWVPPMGKQDLWRAYCTSHATLDQFVLPALGGVGFETLALGRRLITRTDQPTLAAFFGAAPPVLPAASVEEVEASMRAVLDDPDDAQGRGAAGREWIGERHSARRIVAIQAEAYARLLGLACGPPDAAMTLDTAGANR